MIIECKGCSKKYLLDEGLLKPAGSKVRCSRCNAIFKAYPAPQEKGAHQVPAEKRVVQASGQVSLLALGSEKRRHPRLPVSIPVLCDVLDSSGVVKDIHLGAIKEVSRSGVTIELFSRLISGEVALAFLNAENRGVQVKATVVYSKIQDSLKARSGLSLSGRPKEVAYFVAQAMKTHQVSEQNKRQARI